MRPHLAVCAVALMVCACGRNPAAPPAVATAPAPAAAPQATPTAPNQDAGPISFPQKKAGLWTYLWTFNDDASHAKRGQTCVDAAGEAIRAARKTSGRSDGCEYAPVTRDAQGRIASGFTCPMRDGRTVTSHETASGDFSTTLTIDAEQDITGSPSPSLNSHITREEQWSYVGPCPPEMPAY